MKYSLQIVEHRSLLSYYQQSFLNKVHGLIGIDKSFYNGKSVIDVGCGMGTESKLFALWAKKVVAVDKEARSEWKIDKANNLDFKLDNAEKLDIKTETFDITFAKDMLHHANNPERAIAELRRITKSGGMVIIIEGNRYNPISYIHQTKLNKHEHFPQQVFRQMIKKAFSNAEFFTFESHFIPYLGKTFLMLIQIGERSIEKFPVFKRFLSYNVAVVTV